MIEIIALIFLCKKNGELAGRKGLKPGMWKIYTVIAWLVAEFLGILIGMMMFGKANMVAFFATGIFSAFGGYLFIRYNLENRPDHFEEDIRQIGVDDLQPPRRPQ